MSLEYEPSSEPFHISANQLGCLQGGSRTTEKIRARFHGGGGGGARSASGAAPRATFDGGVGHAETDDGADPLEES